jgi:membrane protein YdbS with pleckstrin-like domain
MNQAQKLDLAFVKVERIASLIFVAIVSPVLLLIWVLVGFFVREAFDMPQWLGLLAWLVLTLLGVFSSFYLPKRTYETTSWQLKDSGIEIQRGIWWKHQIFIPRDRIQHTDIKQGPMMRSFGIATLVINTGGTHEPSIPLAGILIETAQSIRDQLSTQGAAHEAGPNEPAIAPNHAMAVAVEVQQPPVQPPQPSPGQPSSKPEVSLPAAEPTNEEVVS